MDRITNDSNLWLNAIRMEDEGNHIEAFLFYLKDSAECLKQNSLVRAALSCSCAANCLVMEGHLAAVRRLYMQAAKIYENNAHLMIGHSIREALWSYQEAYEYYGLARENNKAEEIYEKYVSLSKKVNLFVGEKEAMESLRIRRMDLEANLKMPSTNIQVSADIDSAIENFLGQIEPTQSSQPISKNVFKRISKKGPAHEESITN